MSTLFLVLYTQDEKILTSYEQYYIDTYKLQFGEKNVYNMKDSNIQYDNEEISKSLSQFVNS